MFIVMVFEQHAQEYDEWFDAHELVCRAEVAALRKFVPGKGLGIEVGVGTGRFAASLDITFGVDPSREMAASPEAAASPSAKLLGNNGHFAMLSVSSWCCLH